MKKSFDTLDKLYCSQCGGTNLQAKAWVDPNTKEFVDWLGGFSLETEDCWCDNCEDSVELCTLQELWDKFADIPINNDDEIEKDFLCFKAGDSRFNVWHWFDERCPNGIAVDFLEKLKM